MSREEPSTWFANNGSERWEVVVTALAAAYVVWYLLFETVVWVWLTAGFVAFALLKGPVGASAIGTQVSGWFQVIGVAGRLIAILVLFIGIWASVSVLGVPATLLSSFGVGGLLAVVLVLHSRRFDRAGSVADDPVHSNERRESSGGSVS